MAIDIFVPDSSRIIHETIADFVIRQSQNVVHLVQYDGNISLVKIGLFDDGKRFIIPEGSSIFIKWNKPDGTFVYNESDGCDETRSHVYFTVTPEMANLAGKIFPVVEIRNSDGSAHTATISVIVDRNPIQINSVPTDPYTVNLLDKMGEYAHESSESAKDAAYWAKEAEKAASGGTIGDGYVSKTKDNVISGNNEFTGNVNLLSTSVYLTNTPGNMTLQNVLDLKADSVDVVHRNAAKVDLLSVPSTDDRKAVSILLDNDTKISLYDVRDTKIRTVAGDIPNDVAKDDYIFLEKE